MPPAAHDAAGDETRGEVIDAAHLTAVLEGLAQAKDGTFASDADIAAALSHFGS